MQPRIRIGLIVGIIGLVLNVCVSGFVGLCGPFLSLLAGGIAGFFAAQQEKPMTKSDGARAGATAGGLAGGLIILGQIIGGLAALYYMQATGMPSIFGQVPSLAGCTGYVLPGRSRYSLVLRSRRRFTGCRDGCRRRVSGHR